MFEEGNMNWMFEKLDPQTFCLFKHLEFVSVHFKSPSFCIIVYKMILLKKFLCEISYCLLYHSDRDFLLFYDYDMKS